MTFALYNGNMELLKYLLQTSISNTKKLLKIPGLFNTQMINRIFPFAVSLQKASVDMFNFFWLDLGYLWDEETFENLFSLIAKRDMPDYITLLFDSKTSHTIFEAMSYQYRFSFVEHLLHTKSDLLEEIKHQVLQEEEINGGDDEAEELFL